MAEHIKKIKEYLKTQRASLIRW